MAYFFFKGKRQDEYKREKTYSKKKNITDYKSSNEYKNLLEVIPDIELIDINKKND